MGTRSKIRRVHLKINDDPISCFLGIVSAEPDYKLSLTLNKKLNITLKSVIPVVIETEPDKKLTFSRFSDTSSSPHLIYDLVSNRSDKDFLFNKLKNIDYILQIHDPQNEIDIEHIITILRDTEFISAVFNLDAGMIKNKNLNHLLIH